VEHVPEVPGHISERRGEPELTEAGCQCHEGDAKDCGILPPMKVKRRFIARRTCLLSRVVSGGRTT
jgi:hypothetical protein